MGSESVWTNISSCNICIPHIPVGYGKGRALDNIFIERLWRSVKYEEIYLNEYQNVSHLKQSLKKYFHFYNTERPHQWLKYRTPAEFNRAATQLPVAASI